MMKLCRSCEQMVPVENFRPKKGRKNVAHCDDCYPTYFKYQNIKRKFGLNRAEYDTLVQHGCAVCGSHFRLSVDHDHACCAGEKSCGDCVRGVLCMRHNLALGQVADSIEELQLLIEYLESK